MSKLPIQERLRNRVNDAPMQTEHLLDEAAEVIGELVGALDKAQVVIDYAAERLWNCRPDAIQQRPAHIDAALREVRTVAAKARGGAA